MEDFDVFEISCFACLSSNKFRLGCKVSVVFAAQGSPISFKGMGSTQCLFINMEYVQLINHTLLHSKS